jgi:hypothetical protein
MVAGLHPTPKAQSAKGRSHHASRPAIRHKDKAFIPFAQMPPSVMPSAALSPVLFPFLLAKGPPPSPVVR